MRTIISIINHRHGNLISLLISDLEKFCHAEDIKIVITNNIPDDNFFIKKSSLDIQIVNNLRPRGFGANHNSVFNNNDKADYFCILNPDVRLKDNPFKSLVLNLNNLKAGVVVPAIIDSSGNPEVSARKFPTPISIIGKLFGKNLDAINTQFLKNVSEVDWGGGMFMLFRSSTYSKINGFDESFFLYYEDVDICGRLWESGYSVLYCPDTMVVHDGQKSSHSNIKFMYWHISSMLRYFYRSKRYIKSRSS